MPLLLLLKAVETPIVIIDGDGVVHFWNYGATKIFQYTEEEMIGNTLDCIIPERYREQHRLGLAANKAIAGSVAILTNSKVFGGPLELSGLKKDNSEFACTIAITAYISADKLCYLGLVTVTPNSSNENPYLGKLSAISDLAKSRLKEHAPLESPVDPSIPVLPNP
jgi:hypothetical protein